MKLQLQRKSIFAYLITVMLKPIERIEKRKCKPAAIQLLLC